MGDESGVHGQLVAHTPGAAGNWHLLGEHLDIVAELAAGWAARFGASEMAHWAGRWHDIGKAHPEFQQYLRDAEAGIKRRGPDHKAAGAKLASQYGGLAHLIVGHHGGLQDEQGELRPWLNGKLAEQRVDQAIEIARTTFGSLDPAGPLQPPGWVNNDLSAELFIRMLFSTLVDADFLDTEEHFEPGHRTRILSLPTVDQLLDELTAFQDARSGQHADPVNVIRHSVYRDCLDAAEQEPGFFRLTVPTGGGKTRSGLAFGLRHASKHGLERVIVAIPYTSITDQTAGEYRKIFSSRYAVLEHHSAIERTDPDDDGSGNSWERLAAENWDAPIVVTTTVQLFESLLGRTTSACRKLHNIAGSVIILDEAQTLPPHLLDTILDVLRELVAHYGTTVVLSTATQPALDEHEGFRGLPDVREIIIQPERHFAALHRVEYERAGLSGDGWTWACVAEEMRTSHQALAILNTKADALALLDALDDPDALHLSTLLCGAHRRDVLKEVKRRLKAGEPCRLVATQVVEAGVDLDFPLVLRAIGPLDRIVQAAGRCNREGRLERGRVVVFRPAEGGLPRGAYQTGTDLTAVVLADPAFDFHDPAVYEQYFRDLYKRVTLDRGDIQQLRQRREYHKVADAFYLIAKDTTSVLVSYWDRLPAPDGRAVDDLTSDLRNKRGNPRELWRALQPLMVSVRKGELNAYARTALAFEIVEGLWEWTGKYDPTRGLVGERDPDYFVV